MADQPSVELRRSKTRWWNVVGSYTAFQVVFHGHDGAEYVLDNPDFPNPWINKVSHVPPFFDRYTAGVVAAKAVNELTEMDPDAWGQRWNVPLCAVTVE